MLNTNIYSKYVSQGYEFLQNKFFLIFYRRKKSKLIITILVTLLTIVPFVLEFSFSGSFIGKAFYYAIYILINFVNIVLIGMMSKNKSTIYSSMYNGLYVLYGLAIGS
ncbi:TPA: hypothetical protein ACGY2Z_001610, partial [Listeria monocytogenes]